MHEVLLAVVHQPPAVPLRSLGRDHVMHLEPGEPGVVRMMGPVPHRQLTARDQRRPERVPALSIISATRLSELLGPGAPKWPSA